jgi:hypothetical protein
MGPYKDKYKNMQARNIYKKKSKYNILRKEVLSSEFVNTECKWLQWFCYVETMNKTRIATRVLERNICME